MKVSLSTFVRKVDETGKGPGPMYVKGNEIFFFWTNSYLVEDEVFDATWLIGSFLHYLGQMPIASSLPDLRCIAASVSLCVTSLGCYGYRFEVTGSSVELK